MIANVSHLRSHNGRKPIAVSAPETEAASERLISGTFASCRHLGNASAGVGMMPLRAAESIEHLDFEPVIPCEAKHGECPNVADYLTAHRCPECNYSHPGALATVCDSCWVGREMDPATCRRCNHTHPHGDAWRIVQVLR